MEISSDSRIETIQDFLASATHVFDLLPDAIRVVDLDGVAQYFNRPFLQLTGYSPSEILNHRLEDIYVEDDRSRIRNGFAAIRKTGSTVGTIEARIRRKGGDPLMISLKAILIKNADNEPIGGLAIFRDVTKMERILAEPLALLNMTGSPVEILREIPLRIASYFTGRPWVMINLVEGDYLRFAYAVNVPPELMALGGEPLAGSICGIPIGSGQPLALADMTEDSRVRNDPCVSQYGCRGYLGYPIIHSSGRAIGTICILRNVRGGFGEYDHRLIEMTARRASIELERMDLEIRLQEGEKDLRDLVNNAPFMVWRIFPDGCIQMMSKVGRERLGVKIVHKPAVSLLDYIHPDDLDETKDCIVKFSAKTRDPGAGSAQMRLRSADGTYAAYFVSVRPVYDPSDRLKLIEGIGFELPAEN